jgi:hypothetical protein
MKFVNLTYMKKIYTVTKHLLLLAGLLLSLAAASQESLTITIGDIELDPNQDTILTAEYISGTDTTTEGIKWNTEPGYLGNVDKDGILTSNQSGTGFLIAKYKDLRDSVVLIVTGTPKNDDDEMEFPKLLLDIKKIKLDTGETWEFPSELVYVVGTEIGDTTEVTVVWTVEPDSLGMFTNDTLFTAKKEGEGYIYASYDTIMNSLEVEIETDDDDDMNDDDYPKVKIVPSSIRVEVGDSVELYAFYIDSSNVKIDTSFMWSADSMVELGEFMDPTNSMFYAGDTPGEGTIIARLLDGDLADTVKITVYESKWKKENNGNDSNNGKQMTIEPGDMTVYTGAGPIEYSATYKTNGKKHENAELIWSVSDTSIASIDTAGILTFSGETGMTLVSVEYSNFGASVELLVVDSTFDMDVNSITIHRVLPNGNQLNAKTFKEGDSYKIGGLPYPLNILNGGMLHFPFGCIDEDIVIKMQIPEEYAHMDDDSTRVTFDSEGEPIFAGVKFSVTPVGSDTVVEPYWFNVPVELKLIYKQELIDSLGIDPQDLDVFFADSSYFVKVDEGVATIDTAKNRIYASIAHFSTIVVRENKVTTNVKEISPVTEDILNIYPNPFSSSATIQFRLAAPGDINISVYNLLGQKVQILVDGEYTEGIHKIQWQGNDLNRTPATSGIYFCRFMKDGKVSQIKKIIINR